MRYGTDKTDTPTRQPGWPRISSELAIISTGGPLTRSAEPVCVLR